MRLPVFGKPKFAREDMERQAATELAAALEAVPQPPDPSLASWPAPAPAVRQVAEPAPAPEVPAPAMAPARAD